MRRRRWLQRILRIVGPLLLVGLVWKIGPVELWAVARSANWLLLGGVFLLNLPVLHFKVVRWRMLLRQQGHDYSLKRTYLAVLASLYLGMTTPGRVGDVLRVLYARREADVPYSDGLAVTVMDRFCDMYVLVGFAAVGISHFAKVIEGKLATVTWITVGLSLLGPLAFLVPGLAERVLGRVYDRLAARFGRGLEGGFDRFLSVLRGLVSLRLVFAVLLTIAAYLTNYAQGWLIARAIAVPLGFVDTMGLLALTSLLGLLPISISGLGIRELFLALAFPALGFVAERGVAFGLLVFGGIYMSYVLAGFIAWQIAPPPFAAEALGPSSDPSDGDAGRGEA